MSETALPLKVILGYPFAKQSSALLLLRTFIECKFVLEQCHKCISCSIVWSTEIILVFLECFSGNVCKSQLVWSLLSSNQQTRCC